jgi:hypothetical protein
VVSLNDAVNDAEGRPVGATEPRSVVRRLLSNSAQPTDSIVVADGMNLNA